MSGGQIIGGVGGAVIGFFVGGPTGALKGAMYGAQIGSYLDPADGPNISGPRLSDLTVQSSTYGTVIPRVYGTIALTGNVFWIENNSLKEVKTTKKQKTGGKGGSSQKVTTYSYYATFAVGLCQGPIAGIRRIWIKNELIYDAGSNNIESIIVSNSAASGFSLYLGNDTQLPDDRMQATLGVANTPAYRGLAYLVFKDLLLTRYGNSLQGAQVKVEVVTVGFTASGVYTHYSSSAVTEFTANPYIESIDSQIHQGDCNSVYKRLFEFDGTYSGQVTGTSVGLPPGVGNYYCCGRVGNNLLRCSIGDFSNVAVILGIYDSNNNLIKRIDQSLITNEYIVGAFFSTTSNSIVILQHGVSPSFGMICSWFEVDLDGNLLRSGFTDFVSDVYKTGFSGAAQVHYASCLYEPSTGIFASVYGSGSGEVRIYKINSSNVLQNVQIISSSWDDGLTDWFNRKTTIYISGGVIFIFSGAYLEIFKAGDFIPQTILLSSIVSAESLSSKSLSAGDIDVTALTQLVKGFKISSIGAIRSAVDPLRAVYPFDIIQSGYKIKFKTRGSSSVATIESSELAATRG